MDDPSEQTMSNPDQPSSVVPARPVNRLRPAVALFCLVLACGGKKPADNATGPTGGDDRGSDSGGQQSGANSTANGNGAGASSTGTGGANGQRASSSANARIALGVQAGSPLGDHAHVVIDDGSGGAYVGHLVRRDRKDVVNTRPGDRRLVLEGAEGAYISHYGADYHRQTRFILEDIHFIDAIARHPGSGDLFIAAEEHYYPRKQKQTRLRLLHYTRDGVKRSHDLDKKLLTKLPKRPQQHRIADLTIDDTGDLYAAVEVTRRSRKRGRAGDVELAVARISTTGAIRWYQRIAAKGERSQDGLTAIALTPTGQVVVAGHTGGTLAGAEASRGDLDLFVQVYDGDSGKLQWTSTHGTDKREQAHDVAVAADGSIVLVGSTAGQLFGAPRGDDDALILTVGKDGAQACWRRVQARAQAAREPDDRDRSNQPPCSFCGP